jgi:N-acetylmuramoyl-L-alanine amidase
MLNPKIKIKKFKFLLLPFAFYVLSLTGCATAPVKENLVTFDIHGVTYIPLISLCEQRGIAWEYDTYAKTIDLSQGSHKINLRLGDALALVDGHAEYLRHPVEIYQGMIVVPVRFKDVILDVLFKERRTVSGDKSFPLTSIKTVVIDAGHGGIDPGAIGKSGLREKDVNLDIAKRLAKLLKDDGVEVIMTRSSDILIPLTRRASIANNSKADIFISIHSNANRVRSLSGLEIYYVSPKVSDTKRALSTAEDERLNFDNSYFSHASLDLKATLWDMIYTYSRGESIQLARDICKTVDNTSNIRVIGVKGAGFQVLKGAQMPAILIETGFLSNREEERLLRNSYYRQQIAEAIEQGIRKYASENAPREVY